MKFTQFNILGIMSLYCCCCDLYYLEVALTKWIGLVYLLSALVKS